MAKRKKTKSRKRKSYVTNPAPKRKKRRRRRSSAVAVKSRRRRSYRKNPDTLIDTAIFAGSAVAGAIAGNQIVKFIPASNLIKNLALLAGGVGLAYFGRRKPYLMGAGAGMAVMGGYNLVTNQFPQLAGDDLTQDQQMEAIEALSGEDENYSLTDENSLFGAPLAGNDFAAPLFGAPLAGDMNEAAM